MRRLGLILAVTVAWQVSTLHVATSPCKASARSVSPCRCCGNGHKCGCGKETDLGGSTDRSSERPGLCTCGSEGASWTVQPRIEVEHPRMPVGFATGGDSGVHFSQVESFQITPNMLSPPDDLSHLRTFILLI